MEFRNVKEMMRDLSVSQFTASWARTPRRVWRIHLCWWILHFGRGSVWRIQKLQKCGKRKIFLPHCRSTARSTPMWKKWVNVLQRKCINCRFVCDCAWNYGKVEDEAEFCKPKKVPSAPDCCTDELMCTNGSCVKLYQLCDDQFDCADGADECKFRTGIDQCKGCMCLGDSEVELSGWPTHELLRRKWRIRLRTASAQYRDDLSHPRIHVFTLSPMCHDFWLLWWSSRVRRLSHKLVCNRELNTPDCLRWSTLQPSQSRNFSQYQGPQ